MAYIGKSIESGTFSVLDTSGNTYNGSNVTFSLGTQVGSPAQLLVSHDGVIQKPGTDYSLATGGTQITFSTAPASGASIFIVEISGAVGGPLDSDLNGTELILDADGDTSITADTDDQIDIKIAGADDFQFTANTFTAQSGSTIAGQAVTATTVVGSGAAQFATAGIGAAKDLGVGLHIKSADSGASVDGNADELVIEGSGQSGITICSANDNKGNIFFADDGSTAQGKVIYDHSDNHLRFDTAGSERMRMASDGGLLIGKTSNSATVVGQDFRGPTGVAIVISGDAQPLYLNRQTDDGTLVSLRQANGEEGTISVSGSTVAYNTFCGTHWSRLADNSKPTILRGTVMESIATMMNWYQAVADVAESTDSEDNVTPAHQIIEGIALPDGKSAGDAVTFTSNGKEYTGVYVKEDNEQLPMCKISDTADSKAVYGVFMTWDDHDDGLDGDVNDMYVASLGAFVVRIHKDQTVAIGNWLVSKGDGTAKVLAGNTAITADVQSSIIGKVTSTEKTHTYSDGSYCVPCTLHCG
jgi:hypothetical protein